MLFTTEAQKAQLNVLIPEYDRVCDAKESVLALDNKEVIESFEYYSKALEQSLQEIIGHEFVSYKPKNHRFYIVTVEPGSKYAVVNFRDCYGRQQAYVSCYRTTVEKCKVHCREV